MKELSLQEMEMLKGGTKQVVALPDDDEISYSNIYIYITNKLIQKIFFIKLVNIYLSLPLWYSQVRQK